MAQGKNKRIFKSRKGAKKRVGDPFSKKEVYEIMAPTIFSGIKNIGKTFANKTQGTKLSSDTLKGRIFEMNLADLEGSHDFEDKKIKFIVDEVQGKKCLTNLYGLDIKRDCFYPLLRKWQTLIETNLDGETSDGIKIRLFCIAFTAKRMKQVKKTCYATRAQVKQIRKIIIDILKSNVERYDLRTIIKDIITNYVSRRITKETAHIFPLHNAIVRKVKIIKRPRVDMAKLIEIYKEFPLKQLAETNPEDESAKNLLTSELTS